MNYEALWNGRKRTLVDLILAGKKAEVKMSFQKEYDSESYEISKKGEEAQDELVELVLAEVNQYYAEHLTEISIDPAHIMQGAIALADCKNECKNQRGN